MENLIEQLTPSLLEIAGILLLTFAGWLGLQAKLWLGTKTKRMIAESTVKYVEQIGKSLGSEEKLALAKTRALEILENNHIKITDVELDVLIESAVNEFFAHYNQGEATEAVGSE